MKLINVGFGKHCIRLKGYSNCEAPDSAPIKELFRKQKNAVW